MSKVYCDGCKYLHSPENSFAYHCTHEDNSRTSSSWLRETTSFEWWPEVRNKDNSCELYEPKEEA